MKLNYNAAPNYHSKASTKKIMGELTIVLLVVYAYAVVHQYVMHGMTNAIHIVILLLCSVTTAILCELIWGKLVAKTNPFKYVMESFPWVTAIILTMMMPANIGIYPVVIGTIFAIVVVKLFFGGFGQNIFNPAAAGCAIIFTYFSTSVVKDVVTSATPTKTIASTYGWLITDAKLQTTFLNQFGGLKGLFLGNYDGAIGETCTLIIILAAIYLIVRKIIDWRVPVFYCGTVFVLATIIGLMHGTGMWYPVFHLLTGGLAFGAVFMATDPVTNPTSIAGRIIFAIGCGLLTVLIRVKASLPEGVLYSILLMNMLTPWIERVTAGVQLNFTKKMSIITCSLAAVAIALTVVVSSVISPVVPETAVETPFLNADKPSTLADDYTADEAVIDSVTPNGDGTTTYNVSAWGYGKDHYDAPEKNVFAIVVDDSKKVVSVSYVKFADTEYVGDKTKNDKFLSQFVGMDLSDATSSVDAVTGATYTSISVMAAVAAVAKAL